MIVISSSHAELVFTSIFVIRGSIFACRRQVWRGETAKPRNPHVENRKNEFSMETAYKYDNMIIKNIARNGVRRSWCYVLSDDFVIFISRARTRLVFTILANSEGAKRALAQKWSKLVSYHLQFLFEKIKMSF